MVVTTIMVMVVMTIMVMILKTIMVKIVMMMNAYIPASSASNLIGI